MPSKNVLFTSSALVLGLGAVAVGSAIVADAGQGNYGSGWKESRTEEHQAMHDALESGDYGAWKEAAQNRPHPEDLTEEEFNKLREMHELRKEGKVQEANAIREELGLPEHSGMGCRKREQ